ncbi:hypothetical protein GCM10023195_58930 [Actinoallomurus liliacearum]|uniref:Secreted protein n=1 Tax=Actinoallomurus liliacearum TaxID=1080073 RepID=A0ABP8TU11_9ACTN
MFQWIVLSAWTVPVGLADAGALSATTAAAPASPATSIRLMGVISRVTSLDFSISKERPRDASEMACRYL